MAFLDKDGLLYLWQKIKGTFVPVEGMELSAPISFVESSSNYMGSIIVSSSKTTRKTLIKSDGIVTERVNIRSEPTVDVSATNKKYVDDSITKAVPRPEEAGELVYVRVTDVPPPGQTGQGMGGFYDCVVPAWVSIENGATEGRLRLLSPAVIAIGGAIKLGKLYVSIIGKKYKFTSTRSPNENTNMVNVIINIDGTKFSKKRLDAFFLSAEDADWAGSSAGDLMMFVGDTYTTCGGDVGVSSYFYGDVVVFPDFYNVVARV